MAKFSNLAIPAAPSQVALEPMELESVECMCAISSVATKTGAFLSKWSFASPTFKDLKHPGRSPLIAMFTAEPIAAGSRVTVGVGSPATVSGHKSTKDGVVYENWQFAPGWELTAADADFRLMTDMPVVSVASIATKQHGTHGSLPCNTFLYSGMSTAISLTPRRMFDMLSVGHQVTYTQVTK